MNIVDQLKELKQLLDDGILSDEEFKAEKDKLLSKSTEEQVIPDEKVYTTSAVDTAKATVKEVSNQAAAFVKNMPTEQIKQKAKTKNGLIIGIVVGVIALLVVGGLAINWFGNSDYRAAMKSANTYLVDGKYGDAEDQYKKAHELNPTEESLKYYGYSQELSQVWVKINDGDFDYDNAYTNTPERRMYDKMVSETSSIKEKDVKKAFEDTTKTMENRAGY